MSDYKNTNFESRSRYVKRLKSKAEKKARFQIFAIIAGAALAVLLVSIILVNLFTRANNGTADKVPDKPLENILLLGIEQKEFDQYTTGFAILVYDPNEEQINILKFPSETKVLIPGYGFDSIDKSLFGGVNSSLATASNITGVSLSRYITMDIADYNKAVTQSGKNKIFSAIFNTNLPEAGQVKLSKSFKEIKDSNVSILEVPVSKLKIGNEYHAQPKKSELARLIKVLWGDKVKRRTKVIILNGMGKTGIGGKASQILIKNGFEILDIKNAKSFNYKKTVIALYSAEKKKEAEKVKKALKAGQIEPSADNQGLTDITVIIGKDYR